MQKHQDDKIAEKMASQPPSAIKTKSLLTSAKTDSPMHKVPTLIFQSPQTHVVSSSTSSPVRVKRTQQSSEELQIDSFGATALFSNSDVDLEDMGILNSKVIEQNVEDKIQSLDDSMRAGSEPDLANMPIETSSDEEETPPAPYRRRSHKRSESEPFIQMLDTSVVCDRL